MRLAREGMACRLVIGASPRLLGALLAVGPAPAFAQEQAVQGFVADGSTFELIPSATVVLVETGEETQSGPDGSFSLSDAPAGPISVRVSAPGYQGVLWETEVVLGRPLFLEVLLTKLEGDATLRLRVTHEESDAPIAGVDVDLPELGISAETDQNGEVEFTGLPTGSWLVLVTGFGYNSAQSFIEFGDGAVTEGDVALIEGPIFLPGLTITAEMRSRSLDAAGFYDRERQGFGYHFTPAEIEESTAQVPSDLFRTTPGLNQIHPNATIPLIAGQTGSGIFSDRTNAISGAVGGLTACAPALYVEGVLWFGGQMNDLSVRWIEAVEVYTRVSGIPSQYSGTDRNCGVILIWLK